jgi:hypothetical protein
MDSKYRFSEIVTTIALIEDTPFSELEHDSVVFPNFTAGLDDMSLINAILAQAARESDDFRQKLYVALVNSAMAHTVETHEIVKSDLNAFALAANLAWACGAGNMVFKALGLLNMACEASDQEVPDFAYVVLESNEGVLDWSSEQDPYALLAGNEPNNIPSGSDSEG